MTVRLAPWSDTPDGPFIIELFTAPDHRRKGIGRLLMATCINEAAVAGCDAVALRVDAANNAAILLYRSLGFKDWVPAE